MNKYTELELEVLESIVGASCESTFIDCGNVENYSKPNIRTIRGALGSLVKKGALHIEEEDGSIHVFDDDYSARLSSH